MTKTVMTAQITLHELRAHMARSSAGWQGRTSDEEEHGEDDTHLTAWAWVERHGRGDEVGLAGATVEVRHADHHGGEWCTVVESTQGRS